MWVFVLCKPYPCLLYRERVCVCVCCLLSTHKKEGKLFEQDQKKKMLRKKLTVQNVNEL